MRPVAAAFGEAPLWWRWPVFPTEEAAANFALDHRCGWGKELGLHGCGALLDLVWLGGRGWAVPMWCCRCAGCHHQHPPGPPAPDPAAEVAA